MRNIERDENLNIAMLGHKRIPSREGGIEVVVEELSTRLVRQGHHVTCYNRSGHHTAGAEFDSVRADTYKGVRLKYVLTVDQCGLSAVTSSFFASFAAAFGKYDIVHIHAEGPAFLCWLPKMMGKKVVVTVHGLDHQRTKWGRIASAYIRLGEKNAVRFADEIIVLSKGVKQYFLENYGRKTLFIPNGVNKPETRKADLIRQKWGLEKDNYILFLGRIVPEKGGKYLIEAFKKVRTDKKLVIAGGSSDTDAFINELKRQAGEDDRIIFTGFVQGRVLEELYSNSYLYTLPSDLEGMPLSLLEAMSYGNCCVVSDIPECAEVVEDRAVTFQQGNVEDLRKKLQQLCDDKMSVQNYKEGAAEFICGKYNWDQAAGQTVSLYKGAEKRVQMNYRTYVRKMTEPLEKYALFRSMKIVKNVMPRTELQFEVHLAEHCNLNCKGCDNYSPLANKEFLDINEYEKDCRRLSDLFGGKVERLMLLGGEPLLHPQIDQFIRVSRECFPKGKILIVTNGLLLPKMTENFWQNCKKYDVGIEPTKYPVNFDYDAVEKMAREKGVKYHYMNPGVVKKLSKRPLDVTGKQPMLRNFLNCYRANYCIVLKHGKLYTCTAAAHASIINDFFQCGMDLNERNGIDIYQKVNKYKIMRFLARPIPFCRYCNLHAVEDGYEWQQSNKEKSEWM